MNDQSAAEIKRRMDEIHKTIVSLMDAMKLRQWCVERAVQVCCGPASVSDPVDLAERMHKFVSEPAAQAIEQANAIV